jgi:LPS export ABC transporter protein LptC
MDVAASPGARRRPRAAWTSAALCAALVLAGCQDNELTPRRPLTTQAEPQERVPDQIIEEGTHILTREGVKKAVMKARRIFFYNVEGKVEADSVRVTFFDANGAESSWLNAHHGEIDQRTNDMTARGKVLIVSTDGSRILGEELRYDATRDLIVSTQPVTIFQDNNKIQGRGVEADPALTNIRMTGTSAVLESKPRVGGARRAEQQKVDRVPAGATRRPPPGDTSGGRAAADRPAPRDTSAGRAVPVPPAWVGADDASRPAAPADTATRDPGSPSPRDSGAAGAKAAPDSGG